MRRHLWLIGLIAVGICIPHVAAAGVMRISMGVETTLGAGQVRVRLTVENVGDTPLLDLRPYLKIGASELHLEPRSRVDPGERYSAEKRIPLHRVAAGGYYILAYADYSDSAGRRTTGMLLALVADPNGQGPEGLELSLSPQRLAVGRSGALMDVRIRNTGPRAQRLRIEAHLTPDCAPPEGLPEGPASLPATEGELSLELRFPASPCRQEGEYPLYILAVPVGEDATIPIAATGSLLAAAPRSLLQRLFEDKADLLWGVWVCLLILIASVVMGLLRARRP